MSINISLCDFFFFFEGISLGDCNVNEFSVVKKIENAMHMVLEWSNYGRISISYDTHRHLMS